MKNKKPELLSPIQDFTSLKAAIQGGADAVYFGVKSLNMRAGGAKNFEVKDLKKIVKIAHENKVRCFLAVNTSIFEDEFAKVKNILKRAKTAGIDAVICWDIMVLEEARKLGFEIHLSTQASVSNSRAAEFYRKRGVKRIILARECSLEQIKQIKSACAKASADKKFNVEIETFIHGAMCVAISGRCFMSQFLHGKSANRGECLQPCRREYLIEDIEKEGQFVVGTDCALEERPGLSCERPGRSSGYVMSPKDLCALPFIDKLIDAGIDCFKIEGRNRSPEYVKTVTRVYREAIDYYIDNKKKLRNKETEKLREFKKLKRTGLEKLMEVYNKGFSSGFYLGKPINEWCEGYGSQATRKKVHVGKVTHFYGQINVAEIKIEAKIKLKIGDEIIFQGESTGIYEQEICSMEDEHKKVKQAGQGNLIAVKVDQKVRKGDLVYLVKKV